MWIAVPFYKFAKITFRMASVPNVQSIDKFIHWFSSSSCENGHVKNAECEMKANECRRNKCVVVDLAVTCKFASEIKMERETESRRNMKHTMNDIARYHHHHHQDRGFLRLFSFHSFLFLFLGLCSPCAACYCCKNLNNNKWMSKSLVPITRQCIASLVRRRRHAMSSWRHIRRAACLARMNWEFKKKTTWI